MPEETFTFTDAVMYRSGMFGIGRTDCKTVTVTIGVKYAQYDNATRVVFQEKGKRKVRGFILDYKPWLRITDARHAINPPSAMESDSDGSSRSRYASCDPRWETDFEDMLTAANVPMYISIGIGDREGAHLERSKAMDGKR